MEYDIILSKKDVSKKLLLPQKITLDLAYICGILVGDGSIYQRKDKNDYIIKCVGNPKDEIPLYSEVILPKWNNLFGYTPLAYLQDSDTTYGFTIHSKTLYRYFTEVLSLHSGKKDQSLEIPPQIKLDRFLRIEFIRGLFDTDGCISFKRKYKLIPYYPVISFSSQSKKLVYDVAQILKILNFKIVETYDYRINDSRTSCGFTIINRIELNGVTNLKHWLFTIGFESLKHLNKIKNWSKNSGERI